ncbi:MAG: hypothetical protein QOC75_832, partial [Pseudonocardiales bacterium]|nr:hypothetical protein [Pseudonocardiales bacterium]
MGVDVAPLTSWGDVLAARVIELPCVHSAPCCSVSASAYEDRVLTQARGASPYRGGASRGCPVLLVLGTPAGR